MNVASYIKFDDITNALADLRPTKLPVNPLDGANQDLPSSQMGGSAANQQPTSRGSVRQNLLDTSFNLQLAFSNALDKLASPASGQQTPTLGKFKQQIFLSL